MVSYLVTVSLGEEFGIFNILAPNQNALTELIASLDSEKEQYIIGLEPIETLSAHCEFMEMLTDMNKPDGLNFG